MSIDYALDAHIATITINRPEARNSLDMEHFRDLAHAWAAFRDDAGAWVAVITGVGRDFCTGADLKKFIPELTGALPQPDGWNKDDAIHAVLHRFPLYKPIVAAVNGACVAGGMEMLGGCDLRVAVPEAYFGVMEPKRGLFAGGGTTVRLPRQIPFPAAMEFLLCADRVPAQTALEFGLLNAVVPAEELRAAAEAYAHRITANGPLAVRKTKESVLRGLAVDMKEAYRIESALATEVFSSEDAKEGPAAFAEKRLPRWTGR